MTGVLFWALPLIAISTVALILQAHKRRAAGKWDLDDLTIPRGSMLGLLLLSFYLLAMFAPSRFFADDSVGRKWFFGFIIFILVFFLVTLFLIFLRNNAPIGTPIFGTPEASADDVDTEDAPARDLFWTDARYISDWIGLLGFIIFDVSFIILLGDKLQELWAKHRLPLSVLLLFFVLALLLVVRMIQRAKEATDDDESNLSRWLAVASICALIWYLAVPVYSHSIHLYVPADRGGADFTSMPSVVIHMKPEAIKNDPPPDKGFLFGQRPTPLCLIKETTTSLFVAPYVERNDLALWRQYDPDVQIHIWEIPREAVAAIEYSE